MTDFEPEEDLPPVAHVTLVYNGPVAPHWEMKTRYGDQKMLDDFWTRVHARLLLLPKHDPQFRRNRERVNRDAERERIICDWDLGDDDAESTSTPSAMAPAVDQAPEAAPEEAPAEEAPAADESAVEEPTAEDAPSEEATAEDTESENTAAEDTAAEDTASEDTASEDTAAEDTASEDTAEEPAADEDVPEEEAAAESADEPSEMSAGQA